MAAIRLERLPDSTPVKLAITITPDLYQALQAYANAYEQAYGVVEPLTELIPAMLLSFLNSDKAFAKRRRGEVGDGS